MKVLKEIKDAKCWNCKEMDKCYNIVFEMVKKKGSFKGIDFICPLIEEWENLERKKSKEKPEGVN